MLKEKAGKVYRVLANFRNSGVLYSQGEFVDGAKTKLSTIQIKEKLRWGFLRGVEREKVAEKSIKVEKNKPGRPKKVTGE